VSRLAIEGVGKTFPGVAATKDHVQAGLREPVELLKGTKAIDLQSEDRRAGTAHPSVHLRLRFRIHLPNLGFRVAKPQTTMATAALRALRRPSFPLEATVSAAVQRPKPPLGIPNTATRPIPRHVDNPKP